jgi:hypothetical protein
MAELNRRTPGLWDRISQVSKPVLVGLLCLNLYGSCSVQTQHRKLTYPAHARTLNRQSPFLKAHMRDGRVYILSDWELDSTTTLVSGAGVLLGVNRDTLSEGNYDIRTDSVAIFETNIVRTSSAVITMAIVTGASVATTIFCIANPKACFGSCPTFYVTDGTDLRLQAEGFSSSVAPSLEATDVDALFRARPTGRDVEVFMRNEAMETHVVNRVELLAAEREAEGRVFHTAGGEFRQADLLVAPCACTDSGGDCLEAVRSFDGLERTSLTDSTYLASRETVDLEFDSAPDGDLGLVIAARQSLLSTYLFYQALAYMGHSVGEWLARMECGGEATRAAAGGIGRLLGGIEVLLQNEPGDWTVVGEVRETGPLATNTFLVPLPDNGVAPRKIRLRLTKGHWRLDYLALARLGRIVKPMRLRPVLVHRDSVPDDQARAALADSSRYLVTLPGDCYELDFRLPNDNRSYELFLESRGYYLEWMRDEWLSEENPMRAAMMFLDPERSLRLLAPEFKSVEAEIEESFWNSKYER